MRYNNSIIPDTSKQKYGHEKDFLKLHVCNEQFEAYAGAWLATKEHVMNVDSLRFNLTWVNCEMASFIHMKNHRKHFNTPENAHGLIIQSLDVLDFSVIHLSTYERGQKKYMKKLWPDLSNQPKLITTEWSNIDKVRVAAEYLTKTGLATKNKMNWSKESKRTVAIMPFLGKSMGAGHSKLSNRYIYLEACVWSIYKFIPNIIIGVNTVYDVEWINNSSLPVLDVYLLDELPKSAALPIATVQETKRRLVNSKLDFDYVFYTESDHILIWRDLEYMYEYLKDFPRHIIIPHRLMAYAPRVMEEIHLRPLSSNYEEKTDRISKTLSMWDRASCCMPRQNCVSRKKWVHIKTAKLQSLNYLGIEVPLGNANYLEEQYRSCSIKTKALSYCP